MIVVERKIYSLLDLLGDMGGIMDIIIQVLGVFMFPLSEFSFILKALEKLYLVSIKRPVFL